MWTTTLPVDRVSNTALFFPLACTGLLRDFSDLDRVEILEEKPRIIMCIQGSANLADAARSVGFCLLRCIVLSLL